MLPGRPVLCVDRPQRHVEPIDGSRLPYDHLILATGARNRLLPVPGAAAHGVHYLRTADEAENLAAALGSCASVVIVGAGFIGLEVAAAARKKGLTVTVVEAMDRPMARVLSAPMCSFFSHEHDRNGVRMLFGSCVERVTVENNRAAGIVTTSGERIVADAVVVGIGVVPNTELAESAGLPVCNGIAVDQYLRTPDPRISAIGDCATFPFWDGPELVRLESVQNAVDQARCVADQLAGATQDPYRAVPWFWSEQYGSKLQIAGLTSGADVHVIRGSVSSGSFSVFCFHDQTLLGVESVNNPRDHMTARKLLTSRMPLSPEQAADEDFDLKSAVKSYTTQLRRMPFHPCTLTPES